MKAIEAAKIAGVVLGAYVAYRLAVNIKKTAGDTKAAVTQLITKDLNPASDQNVVYKGVNSVGAAVTGDNSFSLGSAVYNGVDWVREKIGLPNDADALKPSHVGNQGVQITQAQKEREAFNKLEKRSYNNPFDPVEISDGDSVMDTAVSNGVDFKLF